MIKLIRSQLSPLKHLTRLYLNYAYDTYELPHLTWEEYKEWHLKHYDRIKKFRNIHKGESCFIIGNGPSLNKMDLSVLNDYYTFGLNKIYLIFEKVDLKLSYHVTINPYVIEQGFKEIQDLKCPSFIPLHVGKKYFKELENIENIFYMKTGRLRSFQRDISQPIFEGYTVTYVAMQIAFYMGFEQVCLIGVDHNFKAKGNPNEVQTLKGEDINHFSPKYFANQQWQLPDLEGSELFYNLANFEYERNNRKIFDATVNGKLNIFPKISFDEALNLCKKKNE